MADMLESSLLDILAQQLERVTKPASTVLFRRRDSAKGMFVILSGKVKIDTGVDSIHCRSYSPRDVVGLYSALTGREYAMTATVTEDAELGFWNLEALDSLLRKRSDFCRPQLAILGVRIAEGDDLASPREQDGSADHGIISLFSEWAGWR